MMRSCWIVGLALTALVVGGCSVYQSGTRVETLGKSTHIEEQTEPGDHWRYRLRQEDGEHFLALEGWEICRKREIEISERERRAYTPPIYLGLDIGGGLIGVPLGIYRIAASRHLSDEPTIESDGTEGLSPQDRAFAQGLLVGLYGLGLLAAGGYYGWQQLQPPEVSETQSRVGSWEEDRCNDGPVDNQPIVLSYHDTTIQRGITDRDGRLRFDIEALRQAIDEHGTYVQTNSELHGSERVQGAYTATVESSSAAVDAEIRLHPQMAVSFLGGREGMAWHDAEKEDTAEAYAQFLDDHPDGEFADIAYDRLAERTLENDPSYREVNTLVREWRHLPRAQMGLERIKPLHEELGEERRSEQEAILRAEIDSLKNQSDQDSIIETIEAYNGLLSVTPEEGLEELHREIDRYSNWARQQVPMPRIEREELAWALYPATIEGEEVQHFFSDPEKIAGERFQIFARVDRRIGDDYVLQMREIMVYASVINPHIPTQFRVNTAGYFHVEIVGETSYVTRSGERIRVPNVLVYWLSQ